MKNKDMSRRFFGRIAANIGYSALIACMVDIFLVTNVSIISRYLSQTGRENSLTALLTVQGGEILGNSDLCNCGNSGLFSRFSSAAVPFHEVYRKDIFRHAEHLGGRSEYQRRSGGG